jgi:cytochrome b
MTGTPVRIWDLPTRLFHWLLAGCIVGSLVSVKLGGNAIAWHFRFGYAILALVLFRLVWGLIGPRYARFASFPPSPVAALAYLRGRHPGSAGHNPLGAFSVYALLLALAVQVSTGLFANDSIMWDGPLKPLVSSATSDLLTTVHRVNRLVLLALIALHLAAIGWYAIARREPLLPPMLGGDRRYPDASGAPPAARDDARVRALALVVAVVCTAAVAGLLSLGR